jgi:hypothetical protein
MAERVKVKVNDGQEKVSIFVQSGYQQIPTKTSQLINDGSDGTNPFISNTIIQNFTDIASLLAGQGAQIEDGVYGVADATADPFLTFPAGETRLQAYYRYLGTTNGTMADYELISAPWAGSGGDATIEFQSEITDTATIFDGTQKGTGKIYPFNKETAQTVTIQKDDYSENDTINIERRGLGTLEVVQGTDVRFRGVRDEENRFFINDRNSMVSLICRGSNEFSIIGNLKRGSLGAVTTSHYLPALAPTQTRNITVTGTGFSANMVITVTGNATLNSWAFVSETKITLNITSSGVDGDFITVTYDNGDIFEDTNAIELVEVEFLSTNYPFDSGFGLFQMDSAQVYALRLRRSSDDAETDVGFDEYYKVGLNSPVSAGGNLYTWIGGNDGFIVTLYDQGTFGSDLVQATKAAQPKLINAGSMYVFNDIPFLYLDGTDDWMQAVTAQQWASTNNQTITSIKRRVALEDYATLFSDKEVSQSDSFRLYMSNGAFFNGGNINLTSRDTDNTTSQVSAIRRAGVETKLYVNGTLADTDVAPTASTTNRKLNIGQINTVYAEGYMNHCVIWKSDKIASLANIETLINTFA